MYRNTAGDKLYRDVFREEPQNDRPKNYGTWDDKTKILWQSKPIEEVENYYSNLKGFIQKLKHNPRNGCKARALIANKKAWRNGLLNILCNDPSIGKHYRKAMLPKDTGAIAKRGAVSTTASQVLAELEKERARKQLLADEELEDTEKQ